MESARESGHMPPDQMGHVAQSTKEPAQEDKEPAQENKESAEGFLQQVQTVGAHSWWWAVLDLWVLHLYGWLDDPSRPSVKKVLDQQFLGFFSPMAYFEMDLMDG